MNSTSTAFCQTPEETETHDRSRCWRTTILADSAFNNIEEDRTVSEGILISAFGLYLHHKSLGEQMSFDRQFWQAVMSVRIGEKAA
jgi:hypothetical protein